MIPPEKNVAARPLASLAVALLALASASPASAQRAYPTSCLGAARLSAPSLEEPDWVYVVEGIAPLDVAGAQAALTEAERSFDATDIDSVLRHADALRGLYRANGSTAPAHDALRRYAQVVRDAPSHPRMAEVLYRLAWMLARIGQHQRSRQVYLRLIQGFPQSPLVALGYLNFATYYEREGDHSTARAFYVRVMSLDPGVVGHYAAYRAAWRSLEAVDARAAAQELRARLTQPRSATERAIRDAIARDWCTVQRGAPLTP